MKGWNSSLRHEHTHPSHILTLLPSSCPHTWSEIAQGPLSDGACTFPRAQRFPSPCACLKSLRWPGPCQPCPLPRDPCPWSLLSWPQALYPPAFLMSPQPSRTLRLRRFGFESPCLPPCPGSGLRWGHRNRTSAGSCRLLSSSAWDGPLIWPVPQFPHLQVGSVLVLSEGGCTWHTGLDSCSFADCSRSALTQTRPPSLAGVCGAWEGTALTLGGCHPFYTGHFQFLLHT